MIQSINQSINHAISLTAPREMPPKHRQLHAPRPKASGTAFQALVDPPNDGNNLSFDGGDENTDGCDENTVVTTPPRDSGPPASPNTPNKRIAIQQWLQAMQDGLMLSCPPEALAEPGVPQLLHLSAATHLVLMDIRDGNMKAQREDEACLITIDNKVKGLKTDQHLHLKDLNSKMDCLLQKMDAAWMENTTLREAYRASREEMAALKAAIDTLMKKLDENIATTAPPSPDTATSSTSMEVMTMQLSIVQNDSQDVLAAICNPPGKRKRHASGQQNEPMTPTNRKPATNRRRDASPEHSIMHSKHATSAAQDALDALMIKYPPRPLAITSTEVTTDPLPDSPAAQDTTLADTPITTAPVENDPWKTVEGKTTQKKRID
jgi:hypothetical protein